MWKRAGHQQNALRGNAEVVNQKHATVHEVSCLPTDLSKKENITTGFGAAVPDRIKGVCISLQQELQMAVDFLISLLDFVTLQVEISKN